MQKYKFSYKHSLEVKYKRSAVTYTFLFQTAFMNVCYLRCYINTKL